MAKVRSRVLVIDASVAHAAGDVSMNPTSRNCREFLQAVLQVCHRMALSAAIQDESNRHQSGFARTWRKAMMARKKIEVVTIPTESSLERRISHAVCDLHVAAIIEKDRPLIEAAIVTDNHVASLDDQARGHLQAHRDTLPEVRGICWINPSDPAQEAVTWLKAGTPSERFRTLGYTTAEPDG